MDRERTVSYQGECETEKTTDVVKCSSCGANLRFNAATQNLVCDHCGSSVDIVKDTRITENDFMLTSSGADNWRDDGVTVYRCNNCGAKQAATKEDISIVCPFCNTSNIIETDELTGVKPGAVFPFTVSKQECGESCKMWLKKKFFVPTDLKKHNDFSKMHGVYNPAWTFDSQTESYYSGRLGEYYTVTVGSGKNRRTQTRTRYFNISGTWSKFFNDITVEASPSLSEETFSKIRPFNPETAVVYDKKYLAGFSANHYDKDVNAGFTEAKGVMESRLKGEILAQYHYDVIDSFTCYTKHNNVTFKYILLPVWMGNYQYRKKVYHFYVNGNTAKVVGKVPRSGWKIFRTIGIILGAAALACLVVYLCGAGGLL